MCKSLVDLGDSKFAWSVTDTLLSVSHAMPISASNHFAAIGLCSLQPFADALHNFVCLQISYRAVNEVYETNDGQQYSLRPYAYGTFCGLREGRCDTGLHVSAIPMNNVGRNGGLKLLSSKKICAEAAVSPVLNLKTNWVIVVLSVVRELDRCDASTVAGTLLLKAFIMRQKNASRKTSQTGCSLWTKT